MKDQKKDSQNYTTTTPTKEKSSLEYFIYVFLAETQRCIDRGLGFVIACVIAVGFFYYMPIVGKDMHLKDLQKAENQGVPFHIYLIINGSMTTPIVFIGIAGTYYIFYHFRFPFIEKYKANDAPWPWEELGDEWGPFIKKTLWQVAFNNFILVHVYTILDLLVYGLDGYYSKGLDTFPDHFTFFWQIIFCAIVEDCFFHFGHKLMHHPKLYKYHKIHHKFKTPIAISP